MTHGVMVALRFLVSSVKVRVLVGQQFVNAITYKIGSCIFILKNVALFVALYKKIALF